MSDVREVTEWHEAMEGTLTVAAERMNDALDALVAASGIPAAILRIIRWLARFQESSRRNQ